jgi:hypothetical protein
MPRGEMHHHIQHPEPETDPLAKAARDLQKSASQFHEAETELRELCDIDKNRERIAGVFQKIEKEVETDALRILAEKGIAEGGYKESIELINSDNWRYLDLDDKEKIRDISKIPNTFVLIRRLKKSTAYQLIPDNFKSNIRQLLHFSADELKIMGIRGFELSRDELRVMRKIRNKGSLPEELHHNYEYTIF